MEDHECFVCSSFTSLIFGTNKAAGKLCRTVLCNHDRIVEEMSSWTALIWHIGMETAFETKYIKSNSDFYYEALKF